MSRKANVLICISILLPLIVACGSVATPNTAVTILPRECRLLVNQQMPMTLDGLIPPNAVITWEASGGSIVSAAPGLNALLIAPAQPAVVIVSVSITSGTPALEIPITRECIVTTDANLVTPVDMVPQASSQPVVAVTGSTIVISEVMANPCGDVDARKWNEYVELYNYGDQPVDVSGWWLADVGEAGTPDQLVSWSQRNPNTSVNGAVIMDSTIVPARGFAVILSPSYAEGIYPHAMPYTFPQNTIILTAAASKSLGDDYFSIIGDGQSLDVVVLYIGGASVIQQTVSTYGSPKLDSYVAGIRDDRLDNLPRSLHECSSIERVNPTGADTFDNWREISNGSPGEAPY